MIHKTMQDFHQNPHNTKHNTNVLLPSQEEIPIVLFFQWLLFSYKIIHSKSSSCGVVHNVVHAPAKFTIHTHTHTVPSLPGLYKINWWCHTLESNTKGYLCSHTFFFYCTVEKDSETCWMHYNLNLWKWYVKGRNKTVVLVKQHQCKELVLESTEIKR